MGSEMCIRDSGIHDQLSILSTYQTKDCRHSLFTREILNTEIGSALKSGSATPRVAARPQLKHSVGAQHSTLSRAPTCCFLFYSKNIFYLIGLQMFCLGVDHGCHAVAIYILVQRMGSLNLAKGSLNPQLFFLFHSSLSLRRKMLLIQSFGESIASDGLRICSCMQRIIIKHHHHHHHHHNHYHLIFWC